MMKLGLINSAFSQVGMDFEEGIRHARQIGFDTIDIFTEAWGMAEAEKRVIKEVCQANDLPIVSLPVCSLGVADFNEPVRRFHVDRTKSYVDLASYLGARNVLYVMGEYIWQQEVIAPSDQWKWAVEATREIGEYAEENGVEIVVELEPFKLSLVNNVDLMVRFLKEVDHPAVFANIDVSHVVLAGDPPEAIRKLKGMAHHVHLSDCDGNVHGDLPPGKGIINFAPYMRELAALEIPGVLSIELEYCPQPGQIVQWVRDAYEETARLMNEAGMRS